MNQRIAEWEARTGKEWWEVLAVSCDGCEHCREDGLCDAPCIVDGCFEAYEIKKGKIAK